MNQPRFFRELRADDEVESVGRAVLDALAANFVDEDLDYPTDILDTVYAAGLKSYGAFTRGAKTVAVTLEDGHLRVGALDGTKHAGAYVGMGEDLIASSLSPEDVGRVVLEALDRSVARPSR